MSPRPALPLRLEFVLLGLIRRQPIHGYELLQIWNQPQSIGMIWSVKPGPLYASLEKLELLGYLESELLPGDSSPNRKEYIITSSGEKVFVGWMQTPVPAARDFRQDFLAKMYFSADVEAVVLRDLFDRQKLLCQRWLISLQQQMLNGTEFEQQVFSFRIQQVQFILEWLQELYPEN
jgi:PadR family transcriptional regulator, regulatory protein AphA